jgi:hypothetical protein
MLIKRFHPLYAPSNDGGGSPPAGDPPSPPPTQPPAGGSSITNPPAGDGDTSETISLDEAKKLRSEAKGLRTRLKAFEDEEAKRKEASLSDIEKAAKQATEAEARAKEYQSRYVAAEIKILAQSLGFSNPATAYKLIRDELTYDEKTGDATNAEDLLKALLKNEPYLAQQGQQQQQQKPPLSSGGATNPPRGNNTKVSKADINAGRVSRDEMKRLWDSGEMLKILAES